MLNVTQTKSNWGLYQTWGTMGLWNRQWEILRCEISREKLTVEHNVGFLRWYEVYIRVLFMVGYLISDFSLGSFGTLCKMFDETVSTVISAAVFQHSVSSLMMARRLTKTHTMSMSIPILVHCQWKYLCYSLVMFVIKATHISRRDRLCSQWRLQSWEVYVHSITWERLINQCRWSSPDYGYAISPQAAARCVDTSIIFVTINPHVYWCCFDCWKY